MESIYISTLFSISMALTESNSALLNRITALEEQINNIVITPQVYQGGNVNFYAHQYYSTLNG